MRILLDTNVIVDVLQHREPWYADGEKIFLAAAMKQITVCITPKQAADIHYLTKKTLQGQDHVDDLAKQVIGKLLLFMELIDIRAADCQTAIGINNNDFEDAMLIAAASRESMDYIVTRNIGHFKDSRVPAMEPSDFVQLLEPETKE